MQILIRFKRLFQNTMEEFEVEKRLAEFFNFRWNLCACIANIANLFSQNIFVGVFGPLPKILTLFNTNLFDFPYPIYNLTKNSIPTEHVSIKSILWDLPV